MSCSPFDLKDYFFGELPEPARKETESHLAGCMSCRDELAALGLTRAALLSVPDEEPPRRIAFVSDKVFEPRWWQRMWNARPQLGFAAAAMLAAAIVAHGFMMRPPMPAAASVPPVQASEAEIAKRVEADVAKAIAASEERQLARTVNLVNASLKQVKLEQRETLLLIRDYVERVQKERSVVRKAAYYDQ
jgi:anti-sigma factor RsiW